MIFRGLQLLTNESCLAGADCGALCIGERRVSPKNKELLSGSEHVAMVVKEPKSNAGLTVLPTLLAVVL